MRSLLLAALVILTGCATASKPSGSFPVSIVPSPGIQITHAKARVHAYGLVVTGAIQIAAHLPVPTVHSVDVAITGAGGQEIRKFTTQYFPVPKEDRKKPQHAHFTMVTYDVPPEGSAIQVSLTPQPKPESPGPPGQLAPENR